jgi:hypothetical protein
MKDRVNIWKIWILNLYGIHAHKSFGCDIPGMVNKSTKIPGANLAEDAEDVTLVINNGNNDFGIMPLQDNQVVKFEPKSVC